MDCSPTRGAVQLWLLTITSPLDWIGRKKSATGWSIWPRTPTPEQRLELLLGTQRQPRFGAPSGQSVLLAESAGQPFQGGIVLRCGPQLIRRRPATTCKMDRSGSRRPRHERQQRRRCTTTGPSRTANWPYGARTPCTFLGSQTPRANPAVGSNMLALAAVMLALFRLAERAAYLLPVFVTAGASLLIGLMWLRIDQGELGRVAQAPPAAKEEQVVPRESAVEKAAADFTLSYEKKLKQLEDLRWRMRPGPRASRPWNCRDIARAGHAITRGEPSQISPAPAPMAVVPAGKPESLRGRASRCRPGRRGFASHQGVCSDDEAKWPGGQS